MNIWPFRLVLTLLLTLLLQAAVAAYEHCLFDSVSLDGAWEMSYRPYEHDSVACPEFSGVVVTNAVPAYWEDRIDTFRSAGMTDAFRINPWYERQSFPIAGHAGDMTLPDVYGCFCYRRRIALDRVGAAVVRFEGVRNQVHVWINRRFVGFRAGFSTPFELPIPDGVLTKGENEIVLAVSNNRNLGYGDYVSGLTTRSVFRSTGGVNGHLEFRFLKCDWSDVYVTTAKDLQTFTVHVDGQAPFEYEVVDGSRILTHGRATGDVTLSTAGYAFWSPENPHRYELRLRSENGEFVRKFGLRRLTAKGEKLLLNGRPVYLRGVTEHGYFPKTVHVPRDLDYYREITAKRKELGFNFVRFHTFVPPVEYLEATDELGMLVHVESPNFVSEPEYAAIVAFARSHPSVVIYCTGNETRIDRLAETYLEDVADIVHRGTDALFSPMSAMRGVEYHLMKGRDVIAEKPFPHNPERLARLVRYSDLFTSYQLGAVSYDSLGLGTSEELDRFGDVYCGKPRTAHEICIDGSYVDLSLEKLYDPRSPILATGMFAGIRGQLRQRGVLDRADAYFRNSCEWMRRIRKHCFEKIRAADRIAGYDFLGDINTHWHTFGYSVGMMDEFYRLKPGETEENVRRYNSAAVVLSNLGSDFNVTADRRKRVAFSISNYAADVPAATVAVCLERASDGRSVWEASASCGRLENGRLQALAALDVEVPASSEVVKYLLRASVAGVAENVWELYAYPPAKPVAAVRARVVTNISEEDLIASMERGERVLLLGSGPFNALPTSYRIGLAGRCEGNYATVVKSGHPALRGLPKEGFCGWNYRRLMEGGRAVQLEAGVPFDPVIDVASSVKCVIRQALLFEYRIGAGRLMVCSLNFQPGDPAADWLRNSLVAYADSDEFEPSERLTTDQLRAVIEAPLLTGAADGNRARNPNDPSSAVRAGAYAQP